MSSVAKGAQRVGSVATTLSLLGYRCARISASGQAKGGRRAENPLAGDLIAIAPKRSNLPHLLIEVGGSGKRIARAFQGLIGKGLPAGFRPLVVRFVKRRRFYYLSSLIRDENLERLLRKRIGPCFTRKKHL